MYSEALVRNLNKEIIECIERIKMHILSKPASVNKPGNLKLNERFKLWNEVKYAILEDIAKCIIKMF